MEVVYTRSRTFLLVYLKPEENVWHHLLKSKMLPTTRDSSITKERVILMFFIMERLNIDVGRLIEKEIAAVEKRKQRNLYFSKPHL